MGTAIIQAAGEVVSVVHGVESLLGGSSGRYGNTAYKQAEAARAGAYALGVQHGSVTAGRFLVWLKAHHTADSAQQIFNSLIGQISSLPTWQQAVAAGGLQDTPGGNGGLRILLDAGIRYNVPYMGYDTDSVPASGVPNPDPASATTVAMLKGLVPAGEVPQPPAGSGPLSSSPSGSGTALGTAAAGSSSSVGEFVVVVVLAVVGVVVAMGHHRG